MNKLCLLLACLSCAVSGRRLAREATSFSSQDVEGQKLMERNSMGDGSKSRGHADDSASGRVAKSMFVPAPEFIPAAGIRKAVPVLKPAARRSVPKVPLFQPAAGHASSSNGWALNSKASQNTSFQDTWADLLLKQVDGMSQEPIVKNLIGDRGGRYVMMLDKANAEKAPAEFERPTVRVAVSVDWEGNHLHLENLLAFQLFHEAHPEVPLTHFLNAAYFTKSEDQSIQQEWSPCEAFSPIDDFGLHIHGWKSLVERSGVQYRRRPNYTLPPEQVEAMEERRKMARKQVKRKRKNPNKRIRALKKYVQSLERTDVGVNIDISAYTVDELQAIISTSKQILEAQGLPVGQSFRAGAWLAAPNVLEAVRREGYHVNSSAVGFEQMIGEGAGEKAFWKDKPLFAMLRNVWPSITNESQPFVVDTPAGQILEMPDTGGMADYATVEEMVHHVDKAVQLQQLDSEDRFVHLGFHQETAARYVHKIIDAITEIQHKHGHRVVFETLEASAQHALSSRQLMNGPPTEEDWLEDWSMLHDWEHDGSMLHDWEHDGSMLNDWDHDEES